MKFFAELEVMKLKYEVPCFLRFFFICLLSLNTNLKENPVGDVWVMFFIF